MKPTTKFDSPKNLHNKKQEIRREENNANKDISPSLQLDYKSPGLKNKILASKEIVFYPFAKENKGLLTIKPIKPLREPNEVRQNNQEIIHEFANHFKNFLHNKSSLPVGDENYFQFTNTNILQKTREAFLKPSGHTREECALMARQWLADNGEDACLIRWNTVHTHVLIGIPPEPDRPSASWPHDLLIYNPENNTIAQANQYAPSVERAIQEKNEFLQSAPEIFAPLLSEQSKQSFISRLSDCINRKDLDMPQLIHLMLQLKEMPTNEYRAEMILSSIEESLKKSVMEHPIRIIGRYLTVVDQLSREKNTNQRLSAEELISLLQALLPHLLTPQNIDAENIKDYQKLLELIPWSEQASFISKNQEMLQLALVESINY